MAQCANHRIAFIRHAESTYSSVYPDITEAGIQRLLQTAEELCHFLPVPHSIIASPAARTQGSAHVLAQAMGYQSEIITEPLLSDMAYANWPAAKMIFEESKLENGGVENIYDIDNRFEDAAIFEPRSFVRNRFYQYLKKLINNLKQTTDSQDILVISHFEILNHFVQKFFINAPWLGSGKYFLLQLDSDNSPYDGLILYEKFSKHLTLSEIFSDPQEVKNLSYTR